MAFRAAWILLALYLVAVFFVLESGKVTQSHRILSPNLSQQIIMAVALLGTLPFWDPGEVRKHFSWASGTGRFQTQREEGVLFRGFCFHLR